MHSLELDHSQVKGSASHSVKLGHSQGKGSALRTSAHPNQFPTMQQRLQTVKEMMVRYLVSGVRWVTCVTIPAAI